MSALTEAMYDALWVSCDLASMDDDGWCDVYLPKARPIGVTDKQWGGVLGTLAKAGLYKSTRLDWGRVKMKGLPND